MLTIKQITDDKEAVISGLEKKNFSNARAAIDAVLAADNKRKTAQGELDAALAEQKTLAKSKKPKLQKPELQNSNNVVLNLKTPKKRLKKNAPMSSIQFPIFPTTSFQKVELQKKMK